MSANSPEESIKFSKDFHVKEWESLRKEIEWQVDHTRKLELATVAGLAAFYAWFYGATGGPRPRELLLIPVLLALLAGLRSWGSLKRIEQIGKYMKVIEYNCSLNTGGLMGWERYLFRKFPKAFPFKLTGAIFWIVALILSLSAFFFLKPPEADPSSDKTIPGHPPPATRVER